MSELRRKRDFLHSQIRRQSIQLIFASIRQKMLLSRNLKSSHPEPYSLEYYLRLEWDLLNNQIVRIDLAQLANELLSRSEVEALHCYLALVPSLDPDKQMERQLGRIQRALLQCQDVRRALLCLRGITFVCNWVTEQHFWGAIISLAKQVEVCSEECVCLLDILFNLLENSQAQSTVNAVMSLLGGRLHSFVDDRVMDSLLHLISSLLSYNHECHNEVIRVATGIYCRRDHLPTKCQTSKALKKIALNLLLQDAIDKDQAKEWFEDKGSLWEFTEEEEDQYQW